MSKEVLIVGGGPSGMILACELLRRNVPIRLIEKRKSPSPTARAMTLHARTMEMFDREYCHCTGLLTRHHFPTIFVETDY